MVELPAPYWCQQYCPDVALIAPFSARYAEGYELLVGSIHLSAHRVNSAMTHWVEPMGEHARLQQDAERFRTDALRTRIMTLHTFCGVAESQVMLHLLDDARLSLEKIQQAKSKIERHLRDPHHAPPSASSTELWRMLGRVRPRIDELESSIAAEDRRRQSGKQSGKQMGAVITH